MQRLIFRALVLALAGLALGTAACGPNPAGKVPVSSPVYSFQAPDAEDFEDQDDEDDDTVPPDDVDAGDSE
ncbi:MAG: hypothetical protein IPL61_12225 [Myxococcales bacterium]|nr:hypothetical protein [Myxococcales bacterium]